MPKQPVYGEGAKPAGPYSPGIRAGDFLFVSGQGPWGPSGPAGGLVGTTVAEQTETTLRNVEAVLAAGGATWDDVVKATVHLADAKDFFAFNDAYVQIVPEPRPARTTVASGFPIDGMLVEIDVIAYLGELSHASSRPEST